VRRVATPNDPYKPPSWGLTTDSLQHACAQVTIRNAGHMSPGDQPWVAKEMIETWVASALHRRDEQPAAPHAPPATAPDAVGSGAANGMSMS